MSSDVTLALYSHSPHDSLIVLGSLSHPSCLTAESDIDKLNINHTIRVTIHCGWIPILVTSDFHEHSFALSITLPKESLNCDLFTP